MFSSQKEGPPQGLRQVVQLQLHGAAGRPDRLCAGEQLVLPGRACRLCTSEQTPRCIWKMLQPHIRGNSMNISSIYRGIVRAAALIGLVALTACASTNSTEGMGEYVDDSLITTKVKAAVLNEPTLKSAEINVETFKGRVQLSGFVNSQGDIERAVALARGVKGVSAVTNDMRLK
jgi:hypothetical protein